MIYILKKVKKLFFLMESKYILKKLDPMKVVIVLFAILTTGLFIGAYNANSVYSYLAIKILSIIYLTFSIVFLYFREYHVRNVVLVRKDDSIIKKSAIKEYTGSDYRKIFHKRSCRFSDSIKDENLEESDDISYFTKKKYKPCGLCHPLK